MQILPKHQTAQADIFDQIRDGFHFVARMARHVRVREDRLAAYAVALQSRQPENVLDPGHHYVTADAEALATYIFSLDAVNFGSGYLDELVREGWPLRDGSIYYTVASALKDCFTVCGPWSAEVLRDLPLGNVQKIFALPDTPYGRLMASLFTESLNEMGALVTDEYGGSFMNLIADCDGRAAGLVERLAVLPGFRDVVRYRGREFPVFKRAQHVAASLGHMMGRCTGQTVFCDLDRLTMFADDAVPHVLRVDGVLEYAPELAARIDAGKILPAGTEEEIEIRSCAGAAVEMLAAIKGMRPVDVDYLLWHRSVEDPRYAALPAHRTLTRCY